MVSSWYGWQSFLADAASGGVLAGGLVSWTVEPTVIGYAGYLLATPIVHGVHGRGGRAVTSFLMRVLIPAVAGGVGLGIAVASNATDLDNLKAKTLATAGGIGMAAGAGFCTLIDTVFASETVKESAPSTTGKALRVTPFLSGSHVGLGGTF